MTMYSELLNVSVAVFDEANKRDMIEFGTTSTALYPDTIIIVGDQN